MIYYRTAIENGILLLPLIALLPLAPYYWKNRRRGVINPLRLLGFYSFILYAMIVWYFVVLPLPSEEWLAAAEPAGVNLIPLSYFRDLSAVTGFSFAQPATWFSAIGSSFALQYWFNILMLLPLGMYLRYLFNLNGLKTAIILLLTAIFLEVTQLTGIFGLFSKPYRSFDVDDILCNFAGGALGYWLMGRLDNVAKTIEARAIGAYQTGKHALLLRRIIAFAVDVQLVYAVNALLKLVPVFHIITSDLYAKPVFFTELFLYVLLSTVLFKGRTAGKWLLHIRICHAGSGDASPWQMTARYLLLYGSLILFSLAPAFATLAGLPEMAIELLCRILLLAGGAVAFFHLLAALLFPGRDFPWGVLTRSCVQIDARTASRRQSA